MSDAFLLFVWDTYYPSGGFNDFAGAFPTLEAAEAEFNARHFENGQIVTFQIIKSLHS